MKSTNSPCHSHIFLWWWWSNERVKMLNHRIQAGRWRTPITDSFPSKFCHGICPLLELILPASQNLPYYTFHTQSITILHKVQSQLTHLSQEPGGNWLIKKIRPKYHGHAYYNTLKNNVPFSMIHACTHNRVAQHLLLLCPLNKKPLLFLNREWVHLEYLHYYFHGWSRPGSPTETCVRYSSGHARIPTIAPLSKKPNSRS